MNVEKQGPSSNHVGNQRQRHQCLNHPNLFGCLVTAWMLALDATCIVMTMKSLSSSAVALSKELSSSRCIGPNKYNIPGTSGVITIPNSRLLWFKSMNSRSSSFSSLAISSDQAVSAAAATAYDPELTWQILVGALGIFYLTSLCSYFPSFPLSAYLVP